MRRVASLVLSASMTLAALASGCANEGDRGAPLELPADPTTEPPPNVGPEGPSQVEPPGESALARRMRRCSPAESATPLPQSSSAGLGGATKTFAELRHDVVSACRGCHLAPARRTGGFSFVDEYDGREMILEGERVFVPGLFEVAAVMARALEEGRMPPAPLREADPAGYDALAAALEAWLAAGRPNGEFPVERSSGASDPLDAAIAASTSDLGDCIPSPEIIGSDVEADERFQARDDLPPRLDQTDLSSLDAYALALRGTLAYNVEYPLWADDAAKGRWVHLPADPASPGRRLPITFDAVTQKFRIPENTRFYKTFFKEVRRADGTKRFRKVETRLIVTRSPPREPLFGTYVWSRDESAAILQTTPYRDGTPWKDRLLSLEIDEATGARRDYAVPAKHRCVECHMGSEGGSFVLGFTPIQVNRRPASAVGAAGPSERSQVERFIAYGALAGVSAATPLPTLEASKPGVDPRNVHELRAQGYVLGNCAHCHSASGYATRQNADLARLDFSPGGSMFQFDTNLTSAYGSARYVRPTGRPLDSLIYQRLAQKVTTGLSDVGPLVRMPLHTPGSPDCRALETMGRWLVSLPKAAIPGRPTAEEIATAERAAAEFVPECASNPTEGAELEWVEEDFTEPAGPYVPRRADWNDPVDGMSERFRSLELDSALDTIANTEVAVGYWRKKDACQFPVAPAPADGPRPWMLDAAGLPKRPFGEVYRTTPGAWYFTTSCSKCHGPHAEGDGGLAKSMLVLSGGEIRVANLLEGLFGNSGRNLETFRVVERDGRSRNLAGNYLIWMAMEGTRVQFPPEIQPFLGPHGATMLHRIRERCGRLLPGSSARFVPRFEEFEVYEKVCTAGNPMDDPALGFSASGAPIDAALQDAWMDRAAMNAGWAIFEFLKDRGSAGLWPTSKDRCEDVFAPPP